MIEVQVRLHVQHLAETIGERTDQIRRRTVNTESDQEVLVGLSRLLHSRKRKRRETNKKGERTNGTGGSKVETNHRVENAAVQKKARVRNVVMRESRFVAEVVTTRRREMIVVTMATRVGMRVVDLETQVTTNRIAEYRDAMMILIRVLTIVMTAVDADVVPKGRRDPIIG